MSPDVARANAASLSLAEKGDASRGREPRRRSRLGSGLGDARVSGASSRERTWTPVGKFTVPSMEMPCTAFSTTPRSSVGVTSTLGTFPARLSTPTLFSGLDCVFAPASRLMASASACDRDVRATSGKVRRQKAIEQKRGSRPLGTRPLRGGNNPRCWLQRAPMTLKKRGTGPPMGAVPVASWAGNPSSGHTRCCLCTGSSPRAPWRPSDVGAATVTVVAKGASSQIWGSTFDFLGTERKLVKACRPRSIKNASIKKALLRARPRARACPPASFQHVLDRHQRRPDAVHQSEDISFASIAAPDSSNEAHSLTHPPFSGAACAARTSGVTPTAVGP